MVTFFFFFSIFFPPEICFFIVSVETLARPFVFQVIILTELFYGWTWSNYIFNEIGMFTLSWKKIGKWNPLIFYKGFFLSHWTVSRMLLFHKMRLVNLLLLNGHFHKSKIIFHFLPFFFHLNFWVLFSWLLIVFFW